MPRKTVDVAGIKESVNHMLAYESESITPERRQGAAEVLEMVLFRSDNYKGFRYLDGWPCEDETRREYY